MFDLNERKLIGGKTNNLMQLHPIKHVWAHDVLEMMVKNTWTEKEVDLSEDAKQYATGELKGGNLTAYKKALAFLSNLDGIQLNNLTKNIGKYITSPEVSMCIARQAWEEAQHVLSYGQMIESIGFNPQEVYWMFETDELLAAKNKYITATSEILGKNYSPENFVKAVVANIALEGIYFYNGFLTFYALERHNLMRGSAKMVKLIQRDEIAHLNLFVHMLRELKREIPEIFTEQLEKECAEIIINAAEHEIVWGKYIVREGVPGLTDDIVTSFIQDRANKCWKSMNFSTDRLYVCKNEAEWFYDACNINDTNENSFETKITAYQFASLDWDD